MSPLRVHVRVLAHVLIRVPLGSLVRSAVLVAVVAAYVALIASRSSNALGAGLAAFRILSATAGLSLGVVVHRAPESS